MEYSKYQKGIFEFIENSNKNLVIEAVAGSGKTTTILECAKKIPGNKKVLFCAFNKSVEQELSKRLSKFPNIQVKTLHSIGYRALYNNKGYLDNGMKMDQSALFNKIRNKCYLQNLKTKSEMWALTLKVSKILGYIKNTDLREITKDNVNDLCEFYGIDFGWSKEEELETLDKMLEECNGVKKEEIESSIKEGKKKKFFPSEMVLPILEKIIEWNKTHFSNFDDMLWIPVQHNYKYDKFDYIFIDEVQDLNKVQMNLIKTIIHEGTRVIGVGDSKQAIYGFRGALTDGMGKFREFFDAELLPLSICYRCPTKIIDFVQDIVPGIEAAPGAPEGILGQIDTGFMLENVKQGDLVLCRTNSPLTKLLFMLMNQGTKAYVEGLDIGKKIQSKIKDIDSESLGHCIEVIGIDIDVLLSEIKDNKNKQDYEKIMKLEYKKDLALMVYQVLQNCTIFSDHRTICDTYFGDKKGDDFIKLSSVHKAKGLEANVVYILHPEKIPHPMATKEWEMEQEDNLKYVAYTRTKKELYEVYEVEGFDE